MNIFDELKKLTSRDILLFFAISLGVICPGVFWIWTFDKPLLESSSAAKLLLLAGAIGLPCASVGTGIVGIVTGERSEYSRDFATQFIVGCMASAAGCIWPLWMLMKGLPAGHLMEPYIGFVMVFSLAGGWSLRREKRSKP